MQIANENLACANNQLAQTTAVLEEEKVGRDGTGEASLPTGRGRGGRAEWGEGGIPCLPALPYICPSLVENA